MNQKQQNELLKYFSKTRLDSYLPNETVQLSKRLCNLILPIFNKLHSFQDIGYISSFQAEPGKPCSIITHGRSEGNSLLGHIISPYMCDSPLPKSRVVQSLKPFVSAVLSNETSESSNK